MVQVQHLELLFRIISEIVPNQDPAVTYLADHGRQYASDIADGVDRFALKEVAHD
jgi:hypothetical protein